MGRAPSRNPSPSLVGADGFRHPAGIRAACWLYPSYGSAVRQWRPRDLGAGERVGWVERLRETHRLRRWELMGFAIRRAFARPVGSTHPTDLLSGNGGLEIWVPVKE